MKLKEREFLELRFAVVAKLDTHVLHRQPETIYRFASATIVCKAVRFGELAPRKRGGHELC